jgi:hypothetical protein
MALEIPTAASERFLTYSTQMARARPSGTPRDRRDMY